MNKPVLFCYDGSDGSKTALAAAVELVKPADAVVLVVWMPAAVQLARSGSFVVAVPNEGEIDEEESTTARPIAEEGAAVPQARLQRVGTMAQANESVARTIDEIAQEIDAGLVVCGQRGRGAIGSALLGSVSHALAAHTGGPSSSPPAPVTPASYGAPSAASKWWQLPIAWRASAALRVGTRGVARPGRITIARRNQGRRFRPPTRTPWCSRGPPRR